MANNPIDPIGVAWSSFGLLVFLGINLSNFWPVNLLFANDPVVKLYFKEVSDKLPFPILIKLSDNLRTPFIDLVNCISLAFILTT